MDILQSLCHVAFDTRKVTEGKKLFKERCNFEKLTKAMTHKGLALELSLLSYKAKLP